VGQRLSQTKVLRQLKQQTKKAVLKLKQREADLQRKDVNQLVKIHKKGAGQLLFLFLVKTNLSQL